VLYAVEGLYALMLLAYVWATYRLLRELFGIGSGRDTSLVLLFSPLTLYLGYKLLSEVPSLLLVALGSWSFVRALSSASFRARLFSLGLATLFLSLGTLCRVTSIVSFAGLGLALLLVGWRYDRRRVLVYLVAVGIGVGGLYWLVLAGFGASAFRVIAGVHQVVTTHPALERVFALACFVGTFALVLPFAWEERRDPAVRIGAVWLGCAALPFLLGHEPRYYAPALAPLALLSAAGFRVAAGRLFGPKARFAWLLAVLVLVNRALIIPLMPYEVEQKHLLTLFHRAHNRAPGGTYLIPWISDYALLRFSSPESRVDLCLSPLPGSRVVGPGHGAQLSAADQWWAGADHYVGSAGDLTAVPRPWKYLGWTYNPADLRLIRMLAVLGLHPPKQAALHNHLAGSWIWRDKSLRLIPEDQVGQYYLFEVNPVTPSHALQPTSKTSRRAPAG
jgi:hypothetical protein